MAQRSLGDHRAFAAGPARSLAVRVRHALLGISPREAQLTRRGFVCTRPEARDRLEAIGEAFISGYNAHLAGGLDTTLALTACDLVGFAIEGAAMASALVDHLAAWRRDRWARLSRDFPGHAYMIHIGAGWATARLSRSLRRAVRRREPLLGWLVADGWGFHQAYFHPARWANGEHGLPPRAGYLARAVDQGIGRALWFVAGAEPSRVAAAIARFAEPRRDDLWSGVGLAATYAGGCEPHELTQLVGLAGDHAAPLAQGTAFAATARTTAGNPTAHTEIAARALAGRSVAELHTLAIQLRPEPPHEPSGASYEAWRRRLARALDRRTA